MLCRDAWLLLLALALQLSGSEDVPGQRPVCQVHGVLGRSVVLPVTVPPTQKVLEIEWSFQASDGEAERFAWLRNGTLAYLKPPSLLVQRLEMANGTSLRINALEAGDSRVYQAHVTFAASARVQDHRFTLAIYEPVPEPQLVARLLSSTPDGCNVTVRCRVSGKGAFQVSWKGGSPLQALGEAANWYHVSDNGTALHLSWKPRAADPPFFCLASSPAEQKNASLGLFGLCHRASSESGTNALSFWVRMSMLGGLVLQIVAITWVNLLDRGDLNWAELGRAEPMLLARGGLAPMCSAWASKHCCRRPEV